MYSVWAGSQLLYLLENLLENLSFGLSDFVSVYHSQVLVCLLQEVQFADVEDYEL